jgi:glycosyltransferase involved in cell wall biosynthesis
MKFSIGIPAFKGCYLKECIDSILVQSYSDFELIIVNDASPDSIYEIVHGYSDKRIRYFENEKNYGAELVVDNWNKCLSHANGDFFMLMGDDDVISPNYLEEFVKLIIRHPELDVYHCRSLIIDEKSQAITLTQALPEYESVYENVWHRMNGWRLQYVSDFVYRTCILKRNGGYFFNKLAWASDDISSFIAMSEKGIAHINLPIFSYRRSRITISLSGSVELKLEAIQKEEEWYWDFVRKSKPGNESDVLIKRNIESGLPKYIKRKMMETIANHGFIRKGSVLRSIFYWWRRRKQYCLSWQEYVYVLILAIKKQHKENYY